RFPRPSSYSFGITVSCLRYLVLYRFQGSVLSRLAFAARISLFILSPFQQKVNTSFEDKCTFL
ncbi:MAG: hypothetical protein ACI4V3_10710, partial [Faecousia sp.]